MILANWWNRPCCDSRCWRAVMSLEHSTLNRFGTVLSADQTTTHSGTRIFRANYHQRFKKRQRKKMVEASRSSWRRFTYRIWRLKRCVHVLALHPKTQSQYKNNSTKLDSMRWFSHWRSPSPLGGHTMVSHVAAWCVRPSYGECLAMHRQWGMTQQFFVFCTQWPWPLTPIFKLRRDFSMMHLTAKFHHSTLNHSEVIMRTNKLTNKCRWKHPPCFVMLCCWVIRYR